MTPSSCQARFMLFFLGRSGSTYLIEALASHPEICARGEELLKGALPKGADAQLQQAREFLTQPPHEGYRAVGFKTKLKDVLDLEGLADLLREVGAYIILMRRHNSIKSVVSWFNSERLYEATGGWNLYNEKDHLPPAAIDVVEFGRRLKQIEDRKRELESYVRSLGLPTLSLYYEDLLMEQQAVFGRVFSFLGVQPEPFLARSIKNTSDDLREAVSNFDKLRSHYVGSPYERMFDELLVPERCNKSQRPRSFGEVCP